MPARKGSTRGVDRCSYRDGIADEEGWRRVMAGGEEGASPAMMIQSLESKGWF